MGRAAPIYAALGALLVLFEQRQSKRQASGAQPCPKRTIGERQAKLHMSVKAFFGGFRRRRGGAGLGILGDIGDSK